MSATEHRFAGLADAYDTYRIGYAPVLYDEIEAYGLPARSQVLDVGCGTGLAALPLVERGHAVVGVDPAEAMLEHARRHVPAARFVRGTAEKLPFEAESFGAVVCAQSFHWFDAEKALREFSRVVVRGGVLAIWWKTLAGDDAVRRLRDDLTRELGKDPGPDMLAGGFIPFYRAPLDDRRLRVIPWNRRTSVESVIGHERSRARAKELFGSELDAHLDAFRERLSERYGAGDAAVPLSYLHFLYLGKRPLS